jgi:UPF0271 protein
VTTRQIVSGEVLDTAALISWSIDQMKNCFVLPSQRDELLKIAPEREMIIDAADLIWESPKDESLERASKLAIETGDMAGLSNVDLGIMALSLEGKRKLVTDDYRLQNIAKKAGIDWAPVSTEGIKKVWKWQLKCIACKKIFPTPEIPNQKKSDWGECTDCGTQLKLTKRK